MTYTGGTISPAFDPAADALDRLLGGGSMDPAELALDSIIAPKPRPEMPSMRAADGPVVNQPQDWYANAGLKKPRMQAIAENLDPAALAGGILKGGLVEPGAKIAEGAAALIEPLGATGAAGSLRRGAAESRAFYGNLPTGQAAERSSITGTAGEIVGGIAPTAVAVLGSGGTAAVPAFYALQAVGGGAEDYRNTLAAKGMKPDEVKALEYGLGYGAVEFLSERLGLGVLGKIGERGAARVGQYMLSGDRKAAAAAIGHWVGAGQAEGIEEALTQFAQNTMAQGFDESRTLGQGVPQAYGAGVAGGMLVGGAGAIGAVRSAPPRPTADNPTQTPRETGTPAVNVFEDQARSSLYPKQGPEPSPLTAKQQSDSNRMEAEDYARHAMTAATYGNYRQAYRDLDQERVLGMFKNELEQNLIDQYGLSKTKARKIILKYKSQIDALPASQDLTFDSEGRGVPNDVAREAEAMVESDEALPEFGPIDSSVESPAPSPEAVPPLIDPPPFEADPSLPDDYRYTGPSGQRLEIRDPARPATPVTGQSLAAPSQAGVAAPVSKLQARVAEIRANREEKPPAATLQVGDSTQSVGRKNQNSQLELISPQQPTTRRLTLSSVARYLDNKAKEMGASPYENYLAQEAASGDEDTIGFHPDTVSNLGKSGKMRVKGLGIRTTEDNSSSAYAGDKADDLLNDALKGRAGRRRDFVLAVLDRPDQHDPETVLNAFLYDKYQTASPEDRKAKRQFIDADKLPLGTTISMFGEDFDVALGKDGKKVLADGVIIPTDGLPPVPMDEGSRRQAAPDKMVEGELEDIDDYGLPVMGEKRKFKDGFQLNDDSPTVPQSQSGEAAGGSQGGEVQVDDLSDDENDSGERVAGASDGGSDSASKLSPIGDTSAVKPDLFGNPTVDAATGEQNALPFTGESNLSKETKALARKDVEGQLRTRGLYPGARGGFVDISAITDVVKAAGKQAYIAANAFTGEMAERIRDTRAGKLVASFLDDASSKTATLVGKFANQAHDAYKGLKADDRAWLDKVERGTTYSNQQRLLEDTPAGRLTAPNPRIQKWLDTYQLMMDVTGDEAIAKGVKRSDGTPFAKAKGGRMLRELTPDAWDAMHIQSGPLYDAIVTMVANENGTTPQQAKATLKEMFDPSSVREVGAIEDYRKIKNFASHVTVGKTQMPILESDPYLSIMSAGRRMAQRIYFIEKFGQVTKDQPDTLLDELRARHGRAKGSQAAFDDVIRVWNGRPYGRLGGEPRSWWKRTGRVIDGLIGSQQTSAAVIPNIPQVAVQGPRYTGFVNLAKGLMETISHPRASAQTLAEMGAVNRSVMEWTIRSGHVPEDIARIARDVAARGVGSHWVNQFNNLAIGNAGRAMVDQWRKFGLPMKSVQIAKELRLTSSEIVDARKGVISQATANKIVQNLVKVTQYTAEDPHRRALIQNVPVLNFIFAYNSYFVGTTKSAARAVNEARAAIESKDPRRMADAAEGLAKLLVGMMGAGAAAMILRRLFKGEEIKKRDEAYWEMAVSALWEAGVMGSAQRFVDAFHWSNGSSAEKLAVAMMPKVSYIADLFDALTGPVTGKGRYGKFNLVDSVTDMQKRNTPAVKGLIDNADRAKSDRLRGYQQTRARVGKWIKDQGKDNQSGTDFQINPLHDGVAKAISREQPDEAAKLILAAIGDDPAELAKVIKGLKSSMQDKAPLGKLEKADIPAYLKGLAPDEKSRVLSLHREWLADYARAIGSALRQRNEKRQPAA